MRTEPGMNRKQHARTCRLCGCAFAAAHPRARVCESDDCRRAARREYEQRRRERKAAQP